MLLSLMLLLTVAKGQNWHKPCMIDMNLHAIRGGNSFAMSVRN